MGKSVNQTELAVIFGVSDVTLWQWQKEGMPVEVRNIKGLSNEYDTAKVSAWIVERAVAKRSGGETQEQRLKRVQADKIEMEIGQLRKDLVPADDIEARWASLVMVARQRLLAMPGPLAELLEMAEGPAGKRAVLTEEIDKVLAELSADDNSERIIEDHVRSLLERMAREPGPGAGDASAEEMGAAAAPDGSGVGGGQALPEREELRRPGQVPV